jgi:hypothetical protein
MRGVPPNQCVQPQTLSRRLDVLQQYNRSVAEHPPGVLPLQQRVWVASPYRTGGAALVKEEEGEDAATADAASSLKAVTRLAKGDRDAAAEEQHPVALIPLPISAIGAGETVPPLSTLARPPWTLFTRRVRARSARFCSMCRCAKPCVWPDAGHHLRSQPMRDWRSEFCGCLEPADHCIAQGRSTSTGRDAVVGFVRPRRNRPRHCLHHLRCQCDQRSRRVERVRRVGRRCRGRFRAAAGWQCRPRAASRR